mmetsp:Transcript_30231/g.98647  ORF Transcript_30231/g.98647 Transcript_30231/m.98647 type:complete len:296 (+) Transcript_30231:1620-2507(+)
MEHRTACAISHDATHAPPARPLSARPALVRQAFSRHAQLAVSVAKPPLVFLEERLERGDVRSVRGGDLALRRLARCRALRLDGRAKHKVTAASLGQEAARARVPRQRDAEPLVQRPQEALRVGTVLAARDGVQVDRAEGVAGHERGASGEGELDEAGSPGEEDLLDAGAGEHLLRLAARDHRQREAAPQRCGGDPLAGVDAARPEAELAHERQREEHRRREREDGPARQGVVEQPVVCDAVVASDAVRVDANHHGLRRGPRAQLLAHVQPQPQEAPQRNDAPVVLGKVLPGHPAA